MSRAGIIILSPAFIPSLACPHCGKGWWLRTANSQALICGCGYQFYAQEAEPGRAEIRLAYPPDRESGYRGEPLLCACGETFEPKTSKQMQCTQCAHRAFVQQRRDAQTRWRERRRANA